MYTHTQALRGAPELARRWTSGEIFRFGPRASGLADADNRAPPYDFLKPKCIRMIVNYAGRCAARNYIFVSHVFLEKMTKKSNKNLKHRFLTNTQARRPRRAGAAVHVAWKVDSHGVRCMK